MKRFTTSLAALLLAQGASAQSSLGVQGTELRFGAFQDEAGIAQTQTSMKIDVAVTGAHGLQGDVIFEDTNYGLIGGLGAHLYLKPNEHHKYGVFATLADVDGRSMSWFSLGAEGIVGISDNLLFEGRTGLGVSDVGGLDYIYADGTFAWSIDDSMIVETHLSVAEFEEASFQAISYNAGVTLEYSATGSPWGAYTSLSYSGLAGRNSQQGEARFGFGISVSLGGIGGVSPNSRLFRSLDPIAPLIRRDLW